MVYYVADKYFSREHNDSVLVINHEIFICLLHFNRTHQFGQLLLSQSLRNIFFLFNFFSLFLSPPQLMGIYLEQYLSMEEEILEFKRFKRFSGQFTIHQNAKNISFQRKIRRKKMQMVHSFGTQTTQVSNGYSKCFPL